MIQNYSSRRAEDSTQLAGALARRMEDVAKHTARTLDQGWHVLVELQESWAESKGEPTGLQMEPVFQLELHEGEPDVDRVSKTCSIFAPYRRKIFDGASTALEAPGELQISFYGAPAEWQNAYYVMQMFCLIQDHMAASSSSSSTKFELSELARNPDVAFWMGAFRVE